MRVRGLIASAAIGALAAAAMPSSAAAGWHAVAGRLPPHYHLLETDPGGTNSLDTVCYGGIPARNTDEETDCDDNSLTIYTLRPQDEYGFSGYPSGPDHPVTMHGRRAHWHWLQDEGVRYARELVASPRRGLRASVVATADKLDLDDLLFVGRHLRALNERQWKLLLRQTTYEAQQGRFEPGMSRIRGAVSGRVGGEPWRLDVLIPPGYPLSKDDFRPACVELVYRGVHGRGEFCYGDWQRVAGQVFVFGWLPNSWRRYVVHFFRNVKGTRSGRTYSIFGWTRWRFYARPLPTDTCDLYFTNPDDREDYGGVSIPPPHSPDYRRCGFDSW